MRAISHADFARLVADAELGRFDVVVCESIDRLGRNLSDVASLYDQMTFRGIQIHATSPGGQVTQVLIGVMGTMAQMTLSDLRDKTRRGQLGRARAGRIPGGLAFGYDVVPPPPGAKEAGERRIRPDEAAIVRRIFRDFAAGQSARQIAKALNAEGIPGPGNRPWIDTTIRGQADRGTGILNNSLYVGRLEWNRCSYVKNPSTGRRVARINAANEREVVAVPELRIVDDELWAAVKARQQSVGFEMGRDEAGQALNRAHRRQFLLSGLLTCGCCGGGYTIVGKDRYGCATRRGRGTCDNGQTITRQHIEARVLGALRSDLLTPERVDEYVRAFAEAWAELEREAGARRAQVERSLAEAERGLQGMVRAVEGGSWSEAIKTRLHDLENRKAQLKADLAALDAPAPVRLHPNAAAMYARQIAELQAALNADDIRAEATDALRLLIERVVLTPDPTAPDGLAAELRGDLAEILALAAAPEAGSRRVGAKNSPGRMFTGSQLSVVAGAGFEPAAFRL